MSRQGDLELKILEVTASGDFISTEMIVKRISREDVDDQTILATSSRLIADGWLEEKWIEGTLWIRRKKKTVKTPEGGYAGL